MSRWKDVCEELPNEEYGNFLILYNRVCQSCLNTELFKLIGIGYISDTGEWNLTEPLEKDYFPTNQSELIKVSHWMELPKIPKEIENVEII